MGFKYFDAHCHLHDREFDMDREAILARMKEKEIGAIVVGTKKRSSKEAVEFAEAHENIFATVGVHPTDSKEKWDEAYFENLASKEKVVAIGECGLDYFRMKNQEVSSKEVGEEKERQKELFKKHLELSVKIGKPLMIHCRSSIKTEDAHNDLLEILLPAKEKYGEKLRGNMHFFTGSAELGQKFIDIEFSLSFPGVITFSRELREEMVKLPLQNILCETDSPYASPVPYRGQRNEPTFVVEVAEKIASLRAEAGLEEKRVVLEVLVRNAQRIFRF